MKRKIDQVLLEWRDDSERKPLIIRGARQSGKTFSVDKFGESAFESYVSINLEKSKPLHPIFDSLDPKQIIAQIEIRTGQSIVPGKTLLFLDEIQSYPNALMALRYFKEEMRELHVISAGSLLEFALEEEEFSFPVGRVQFLYMYPLTFREFLRVLGYDQMADYLQEVTLDQRPDESLHQQLLKLAAQFFLLGGMPEVVNSFLAHRSFLRCQKIQRSILDTYLEDFGKYAKTSLHPYLQTLFWRAPDIVGEHLKYAKIDPTVTKPERVFSQAVNKLSKAGVIHQIFASAANGIPLRAEKIANKLKILFLDVGLMQCALGLDLTEIEVDNLLVVNEGALAEQFVGQEMLANRDSYEKKNLYFWERLKKGSEAEVDYLVAHKGKVYPVEVKAGKTGRLMSLKQFLKDKKVPFGLRISEKPLHYDNQVLSVPLYMISELERLIDLVPEEKASSKG